jgi:hypothetical protein
MATLKTKPEFGEDDHLTPECLAAVLAELDAAHARRKVSIEAALRGISPGDTVDISFNFTFNKEQ